jgi:hypothetical protein
VRKWGARRREGPEGRRWRLGLTAGLFPLSFVGWPGPPKSGGPGLYIPDVQELQAHLSALEHDIKEVKDGMADMQAGRSALSTECDGQHV